MRVFPVAAILGFILLLAACADEAPPPAPPLALPPPPTLATLGDVAQHPERNVPAAVIGRNEARISAEVAATIQALPVAVGERVAAGAVIARLDPRDAALALERAEAALAQAAARLNQAEAQLKRAQTLREKNFYAAEALTLRETERAGAAADARAARANRDTARRTLEKHTLRAPFAGVVRDRPAQLGELATPGSVLLTLVSADDLELAAQLQPADVEAVRLAGAWEFESAGVRHALRLIRVSPAMNPASRSVEARFGFTAQSPAIGQEGRLLWRESRPWLPADLLVRRNGEYGVFVAIDGKARFHVLAGASEGRPVRVDLPAETRIVVEGRHALQDGAALP